MAVELEKKYNELTYEGGRQVLSLRAAIVFEYIGRCGAIKPHLLYTTPELVTLLKNAGVNVALKSHKMFGVGYRNGKILWNLWACGLIRSYCSAFGFGGKVWDRKWMCKW